jgi:hypothetical protein
MVTLAKAKRIRGGGLGDAINELSRDVDRDQELI